MADHDIVRLDSRQVDLQPEMEINLPEIGQIIRPENNFG